MRATPPAHKVGDVLPNSATQWLKGNITRRCRNDHKTHFFFIFDFYLFIETFSSSSFLLCHTFLVGFFFQNCFTLKETDSLRLIFFNSDMVWRSKSPNLILQSRCHQRQSRHVHERLHKEHANFTTTVISLT